VKTSFAAVLLLAASARAGDAIYKWTDAQGEEHFTNDPSSIPQGQKATVTEGAELGVLSIDRPDPKPDQTKGRKASETPKDNRAVDDKEREQAWRDRFRDARSKVGELETLVTQDKARVQQVGDISASVTTAPNGMTRQARPSDDANQQLKKDQSALKRAQEDLDDLERSASQQAIPRAWRE
jgi:hypothetical protein